jgi:hypothetical protein
VFLGRPPRMSKKFAHFQIPLQRANPETENSLQNHDVTVQAWDQASKMSYRADTRWSALCAFIKEDILELLYSGPRKDSAKIRYGSKTLVSIGNSFLAVKFLGERMSNGKLCLLIFDSTAV